MHTRTLPMGVSMCVCVVYVYVFMCVVYGRLPKTQMNEKDIPAATYCHGT